MKVCGYVGMNLCRYEGLWACMYVAVYVVTYVVTYVRMYVCMYVCMYVRIYPYGSTAMGGAPFQCTAAASPEFN